VGPISMIPEVMVKIEKAGGKVTAMGSSPTQKRVTPAPENPSPWKKSTLKHQLRSLVLKPTVKLDPHVQVSTVVSSEVPTPVSESVKSKLPVSSKSHSTRLTVPSAPMKLSASSSPSTCVSVTRPIGGTLPFISYLPYLSLFMQTFISESISVASSSLISLNEPAATTLASGKSITVRENTPSGGGGKCVPPEPLPGPRS
jgi:hypothetical protein